MGLSLLLDARRGLTPVVIHDDPTGHCPTLCGPGAWDEIRASQAAFSSDSQPGTPARQVGGSTAQPAMARTPLDDLEPFATVSYNCYYDCTFETQQPLLPLPLLEGQPVYQAGWCLDHLLHCGSELVSGGPRSTGSFEIASRLYPNDAQKANAFQHALWMAMTARELGFDEAIELGIWHEVDGSDGPVDTFKDLHNNQVGAYIGSNVEDPGRNRKLGLSSC